MRWQTNKPENAAANEEEVRCNNYSTKATIRRATKGENFSNERIRRVYDIKGE